MPNNSPSLAFPHMVRIAQINDYYCGPAVLQMLLHHLHLATDQETLVDAAGIRQYVKTHGITLEEMAQAVTKLYPDLQFWFKRYSTLSDLSHLVNHFQYPVGVEWQGIFDDTDDNEEELTEDSDDDPGHYSIVTAVSTRDNYVLLADPYHNKGKDRQLTILEFDRRWWDINERFDPTTKRAFEIDDYHAMFIIIPKHEDFPKELRMNRL